MNINIDVSNINFCPGPCKYKMSELEPININSELYYLFKPHSGGRYKSIYYPFKKQYICLKNVRICSGCNNRHLEFWDEKNYEQLEKDANIIIKKLNLNLDELG
tara:strand:+ start:228 stop:539 length:312 start_codon:yes stop_codon:yes gene_type:complete